jgi:O-antigen/teichoic acid export membrane protein
MVGPVSWACSALLVNQPNGYAEMGVYNAVLRFKQVPEMVLMTLMAPLLPMLSECFGKGDTKSYNKVLSNAFALSLCIIVPVSLIQAAVPTLTLLPYGQEYQGNASVVQWLMLHAVLIGLFQPFGSILASMNRMWFGFTYNLFWGIAFMALAYLFVPRYGAAGLAAAFALTHLVTSLFCVAYIYHYEKAFIVDTPLAYCAISALLLFGICIIASHCVPPSMAGGTGCTTAFAYVVTVMRLIRVRRAWPRSAITTETFQGE